MFQPGEPYTTSPSPGFSGFSKSFQYPLPPFSTGSKSRIDLRSSAIGFMPPAGFTFDYKLRDPPTAAAGIDFSGQFNGTVIQVRLNFRQPTRKPDFSSYVHIP